MAKKHKTKDFRSAHWPGLESKGFCIIFEK